MIDFNCTIGNTLAVLLILKIFNICCRFNFLPQLGDESQNSVKKDGILLQYLHLADCREPGIIVRCYFASAYDSTHRMNAAMILF